ncbi:MAG: hypothetical protein N3A01_09235 [Bacteroidales bacterium]|nr:hypothetical protein [Bacteroidales bacterium]
MRRLLVIIFITFALAYLWSCKSSEKCPAYGENNTLKVENRA